MIAILQESIDFAVVGWVMVAIGILLVAVIARELRNVPGNLLTLMLTAFLDMAGLFIVIPLVPYYVERFHESGETLFGLALDKGLLTGLVVTAFTAAQSITAPFWGRISDRHGRRPVLLVALGASTCAYLLFGFADSLSLLLLSRVVQGAGGGMVSVVQAYVADSVEPAQRARGLGWLSASTNLGVALGPVIGSWAVSLGAVDLLPGDGTLQLGSAGPGVVAASLCVVNALLAARFVKESSSRESRAKSRPSIRSAVRQIVAHPKQPTTRIVLIYAIAIGSAHGINPLLPLFLEERLGIDENSIWCVFMYIGSMSVFARVLLLGRAVDRFGEVRVSRIGICSLASAFLLMPFVGSLGALAIVIAFHPLGMALTFPCLTALLSQIVPPSERGTYLGLQQSFAGLARILSPLLYGVAFDLIGSGAPFWGAGTIVLSTLLIGIGLARAAANARQ